VAEPDLKGNRVFLIEDEATISMLIEDTLIEIGCNVVETASRLPEALDKAARIDCDVAVIDVNLNGKQTFDVAHTLMTRGIPFVFSTGYGATVIPDDLHIAPVLQKPFRQEELENALRKVLSSAA
jgi:CheY-like chemotaxis protein